MSVIKAIWVPWDDDRPLTLVQFDTRDLSQFQRYVGGLIEAIDLERPDCTMFVHEEGKLLDFPINRRATYLLWAHLSRYRGLEIVAGHALITGVPDEQGDTQSVPEDLVRVLFHTGRFQYQINTLSCPAWSGNQLVFGDWEQAYRAAIALAQRWALVDHVRVIPV